MVRRREIVRAVCVGGVSVLAGCGASGGTRSDSGGGGTRIEAPLVGSHVSGLDTSTVDRGTVARQVADTLGVKRTDVRVRPASGAVEVFAPDVDPTEFAAALTQAGLDSDVEDVRQGVTNTTRAVVVTVLRDSLASSSLSDGDVTQTDAGLIAVELPGADPEAARSFLTAEPDVYIVAVVRKPETETTTKTTILAGSDIAEVGSVEPSMGDSYRVTVTVADHAAGRFRDSLVELGFTDDAGMRNCDRVTENEKPGSYCLLTESNGQVVHSNLMGDLADPLRNGDWQSNPTFSIGASTESTAEEMRAALRRGSLPTGLALDAASARTTRIDE